MPYTFCTLNAGIRNQYSVFWCIYAPETIGTVRLTIRGRSVRRMHRIEYDRSRMSASVYTVLQLSYVYAVLLLYVILSLRRLLRLMARLQNRRPWTWPTTIPWCIGTSSLRTKTNLNNYISGAAVVLVEVKHNNWKLTNIESLEPYTRSFQLSCSTCM